jgi:hypothetical protein
MPLGPCFQYHVERCFCGAPHAGGAALGNHLTQPRFSCLGAESRADLLGERRRHADHRRRRIVQTANGVEIVLKPIMGLRKRYQELPNIIDVPQTEKPDEAVLKMATLVAKARG